MSFHFTFYVVDICFFVVMYNLPSEWYVAVVEICELIVNVNPSGSFKISKKIQLESQHSAYIS